MHWMICMDCGQRVSSEKLDDHDTKCKKRLNTKRFDEKPKIADLEKALNSEEEKPLTILPNGEILTQNYRPASKQKPLTYRENLGGEYAA